MPPPALNQPLDLHKPLTELVSQLDGLNIVITGAASGLGREMVRLWAKGGANILIGDLNLQGAETVADELRSKHAKSKDQVFETIKVDVTSHASQLAMFRKALTSLPGGRIDIVVANAGVGEVGAKTAFGGEQSGSGKTAGERASEANRSESAPLIPVFRSRLGQTHPHSTRPRSILTSPVWPSPRISRTGPFRNRSASRLLYRKTLDRSSCLVRWPR